MKCMHPAPLRIIRYERIKLKDQLINFDPLYYNLGYDLKKICNRPKMLGHIYNRNNYSRITNKWIEPRVKT